MEFVVTREELSQLGFEIGTGNWSQETWVYKGIVWVYFDPLSEEAQRSRRKDLEADGPRAHIPIGEFTINELRLACEARYWYEEWLSATYDEAND